MNTGEMMIQMEEIKTFDNLSKQVSTIVKSSCQCKHILVVDDSECNILVMRGILKLLNMDCDIARNGKEAVEAVEARRIANVCCNYYSLIFTDCYMPVMNGFEVI